MSRAKVERVENHEHETHDKKKGRPASPRALGQANPSVKGKLRATENKRRKPIIINPCPRSQFRSSSLAFGKEEPGKIQMWGVHGGASAKEFLSSVDRPRSAGWLEAEGVPDICG